MSFSYLSKRIFVFLLFAMPDLGCTAQPKIWNIPIESTKFFGRGDYVKNIGKALNQKGFLIISGSAGVGKTTLAHHYARKHRDYYDLIWQFNSSKTLTNDLVSLAEKLSALEKKKLGHFSTPEECVEFVKEWLRLTPQRWLIIFDDIESYEALSGILPERDSGTRKHAIVTYRSTKKRERSMLLEEFTNQESLDYLRYHLGDLYRKEDLILLYETLARHPLALSQAVAYIKESPNKDIHEYIELFQKKNKQFWDIEKEILNRNKSFEKHKQLFTSIKMSLEKLKSKNTDAYMLLLFLSHINFSRIEKEIINLWINEVNKNDIISLGDLLDHALIVEVRKNSESSDFSIHDYVRSVVKQDATEDQRSEAFRKGIFLFSKILEGNLESSTEVFSKNPKYLYHLLSLLNQFSLVNADKDMALEVYIKTLYYAYYYKREYSSSFDLANKISSCLDKNKITDQFLVGTFHGIYSCMKHIEYSIDDAIEESKKAYEVLKKVDSTQATRELIFLLTNNLGGFFHWKGDNERAESCLQEGISLSKKCSDDETIISIGLLRTVILIDRGHFDEAEKVIEQLEKIINKTELQIKTCGAFAKALHTKILLKKGNPARALSIARVGYNLALESAEGNELLETVARVGVYLSRALCEMGDLMEAENVILKALKSFDRHFRNPHKNRRQAYAHMVRGDIYFRKGELENALKEYLIANSIYDNLFERKNVDDISELYFRIGVVGIEMKDELIIKEYMDRLIDQFGLSHKRTIELAKKIDDQGMDIKILS